MHFWEIIKLQFEKERHTLLCILKLFTNIIHEFMKVKVRDFEAMKGIDYIAETNTD